MVKGLVPKRFSEYRNEPHYYGFDAAPNQLTMRESCLLREDEYVGRNESGQDRAQALFSKIPPPPYNLNPTVNADEVAQESEQRHLNQVTYNRKYQSRKA